MLSSIPSPSATRPDKRIQELLSCNIPPLDSEIQDLLPLKQEQARLSAVENQINQLHKRLTVLISEREKIEMKISQYQTILHPVRRLPEDILREISLYFLDEEIDSDSSQTSLEVTYMPWTLAKVSRRWRDIMLGFTRIWATVRVRIRPSDLSVSQSWRLGQCAYLLGLQLQQAVLHPLSVYILSRDPIPDLHPLLQILLPTSARWKRLTIRIPYSSFKSLLPVEARLQSLDTLFIDCGTLEPFPDPSSITVDSPIARIFRFAPKLIEIAGEPLELMCCGLPWSQLHTFKTGNFWRPGNDILNLLRHMPNITCIRGFIWKYQSEFGTVFDVLHLDHVTVLELGVEDCDRDLTPFLQHLNLPILRDLEIHVTSVGPINFESIGSLVQRCCCPLTTLRITALSGADDSCLALLAFLPSLNTLVLDCSGIVTESFMRQLTRNSPFLVPLLASLTLEQEDSGDDTYTMYQELKTARPQLRILASGVYLA